MKNFIKIAGVIAMVAVIGLSFIACFGSGGGSGGGLGRASVAPAEDFEYQLTEDGSGVVIKEYIGKGGNIIVPGEIEGFPVKELWDHCFEGTAVTSVVLPDSLAPWWIKISEEEHNIFGSSISPSRLFQDSSVQAVTFPAGITIIPTGTFNGCKELTTFSIPDTVFHIADYAYMGSGLTPWLFRKG